MQLPARVKLRNGETAVLTDRTEVKGLPFLGRKDRNGELELWGPGGHYHEDRAEHHLDIIEQFVGGVFTPFVPE